MPTNSMGQNSGAFGSNPEWRFAGLWYKVRSPSGGDFTPSAPSSTPSQQVLPVSKYGDTIPVVYGICRVPGSYIWAPDFEEDGSSGTVVKVLRARIRFARPLVANSNWQLRRLWSDGKLVLNRSTGARSSLISRFRSYDGQTSQGRDALQVEVEGEDNVSAHRGYLDMVITMQLTGERQPPSFDAEWVQDAAVSGEIDPFEGLSADVVDTVAGIDYGSNTWYGFSASSSELRRFSIGLLHEVFAVALTGFGRAYVGLDDRSVRYIPSLGLVLGIGLINGFGGGRWPLLINPFSGTPAAEADLTMASAGQSLLADGVNMWGTNGVMITSASSSGFLAVFRFNGTSMVRVAISGTGWDGRGTVNCITFGDKRATDADVFLCAGTTLYKARVSMFGVLDTITSHATFADDLVYAVYHEGDIVVWTDNQEVKRVDGTTGATEWTESLAYQTNGMGSMAAPDANRFVDEFYAQGSTTYYFTSLVDGSTRTLAKPNEISSWKFVYDGSQNIVITTDNNGSPYGDLPLRRTFDNVGSGTTRDLEDFVAAVWESGEAFTSLEHSEVGYASDQIKGAVIDITTGQREVVRSVAGPYSFSIFERSGQIITKRALTDGSFAVDATLSTNDFVDRGGQAIKATKLNPEEFIARYGITHRDQDAIYQPLTQYGEIQFTPYPVSPTDLSTKVDIPVIHTANAIKTLATQKVRRMAEEKHDFSYPLRAKWIGLEPEDVAQFPYANRTITARITETTINPDFTIDVRCTEFLSSVAATVLGAINTPSEPGEVGSPESTYYHLDIPLLTAADDLSGTGLVQYHVLTSQGQDNWDGATLYRDNVTTGSTQLVDGLVGIAVTALPDWEIPYATEFTRTINVAFITGDTSTLASATYDEVCAGANRFAIGAPGRWEVCHVIDISDNGDGSFAFTGLRRGRGTSEEFTATHEAGDFVVWLGSNVQHLDYAVADLNDAFSYKAVGSGGNVITTPAVSRTVTGEAEKIPKPAQIAVVRDGTKLVISWRRRSRVGAYWAEDGEDTYTTPLGETLEQYVVRILDAPGGTLKRTFTTDDATEQDYTDAEQTSDFGSTIDAGETIYGDIRQVSGTGVVCPSRAFAIPL